MSQPNRLRSTTTALAMLRRGWEICTPDRRFIIKKWNDSLAVYDGGGKFLFPLTVAGFNQMMDTVVNPPFPVGLSVCRSEYCQYTRSTVVDRT